MEFRSIAGFLLLAVLVYILFYVIVTLLILWFVFGVAIPLIIINAAIISLIFGLTIKQSSEDSSQFLLFLSILGAIYIVVDYNADLLTKVLVSNVSDLDDLIPIFLYVNIIAGLIAAYFLICDPIEREFSGRNLITMACLLFVGCLTIGFQRHFDLKRANEAHLKEVTDRKNAEKQAHRADSIRVAERTRAEQGFLGEWHYSNRTDGRLAELRISRHGDGFSGEYRWGEQLERLSGELLADNRLRLINIRQYGKIVPPFTWYEGDFSHEATAVVVQ